MIQAVPADPPYLSWGTAALWAQLEPLLPGLSVEVLARAASTNTELLERARLTPAARSSGFGNLGEPAGNFGRRQADTQPCLLVAEHQTLGRGRLGRNWRSTRGASLTFSLALPLAPPDWSGLSLAVGVALAEALQPDPHGVSPALALKWPNDLWLIDGVASPERPFDGRKLGGVLIETLAAGSRRLAVIGIGLNVLPLDEPLPPELHNGAACVRELDAEATAPSTLARVALPLLQALKTFEREGFAAFADRYAARDLLLDQSVTTTQSDLPHGTARGVDGRGALRIETANGVQLLSSGEVSVRLARPVAGLQ